MDHYIGCSLEKVINELQQKGIAYTIVDNNHNVQGDTKLVTNIQLQEDKTAKITVGEFIFNLKD